MQSAVDPGRLVDDDLELVLERFVPADPTMDRVPVYHFRMQHLASGQKIGGIVLRVGSTPHLVRYAGQLGYGVEPEFRGHHYAARACVLLLPLARLHGLDPVWITCDPTNLASRRSCELAGAVLDGIVDVPRDTDMYREGERQKCLYRSDREAGSGPLRHPGPSPSSRT